MTRRRASEHEIWPWCDPAVGCGSGQPRAAAIALWLRAILLPLGGACKQRARLLWRQRIIGAGPCGATTPCTFRASCELSMERAARIGLAGGKGQRMPSPNAALRGHFLAV